MIFFRQHGPIFACRKYDYVVHIITTICDFWSSIWDVIAYETMENCFTAQKQLCLEENKDLWMVDFGMYVPVHDGRERKTSDELDDIIHHCLDQQICTFMVTEKKGFVQNYYHCLTCAPEQDNVVVCQTCREKCHENHTLSDSKQGSVYCDCGASSFNSSPCLCLKQ